MKKIHPALTNLFYITKTFLNTSIAKKNDFEFEDYTAICKNCGMDKYAHNIGCGANRCPKDLDKDGCLPMSDKDPKCWRRTHFKLDEDLTTAYRVYLRLQGVQRIKNG